MNLFFIIASNQIIGGFTISKAATNLFRFVFSCFLLCSIQWGSLKLYGQHSFDPPPSGIYSLPISIEPASSPDETILYTSKGIVPNVKLTKELKVEVTSQFIFKVRFKKDQKIVDSLFSRTYVFNLATKFPILSIAIAPEDLWNDTTGIYVKGKYALFNDSTGHWDSCNYQKNWEREIYVTYIEPNNTVGFSQRAGIKIFGESTRRQPDKSLKIIARKAYGKGKFKHSLFHQKELKSHKQLVIRTSGNDFNNTRFKDVLSTHLVAPLSIDYMAYQPIQLYVNGEHWGLYNLREKISEHYISENYAIPKDSVNIIMGKWVRQHGRSAQYMAMYRFFENVEEMNAKNYAIAKEFLDMRNYINYRVFQIYINNKDSRGNIRYWNANGFQKAFKMIVYDTDLGYDLPEYNYLKACLSPTETNWHNPTWATLYLRKLITNHDFKNEFINQFAHLMNTTLHTDSIMSQIDFLQTIYYGELPQDKSKRPSHLKSVVFPTEQWNKDVEKLRDFARKRGDFLRKHIIEEFNLTGVYNLQILGNEGRIIIQNNYPQTIPFRGIYFKDVALEIIALNNDGYKFSHWSDGDTNKIKTVICSTDTLILEALYVPNADVKAEKYDPSVSLTPHQNYTSASATTSLMHRFFGYFTLELLAYSLLMIGVFLLVIYILWK